MIANKWPNFLKAFDNFDIDKVAAYGLNDQERLKNDSLLMKKPPCSVGVVNGVEDGPTLADQCWGQE